MQGFSTKPFKDVLAILHSHLDQESFLVPGTLKVPPSANFVNVQPCFTNSFNCICDSCLAAIQYVCSENFRPLDQHLVPMSTHSNFNMLLSFFMFQKLHFGAKILTYRFVQKYYVCYNLVLIHWVIACRKMDLIQ